MKLLRRRPELNYKGMDFADVYEQEVAAIAARIESILGNGNLIIAILRTAVYKIYKLQNATGLPSYEKLLRNIYHLDSLNNDLQLLSGNQMSTKSEKRQQTIQELMLKLKEANPSLLKETQAFAIKIQAAIEKEFKHADSDRTIAVSLVRTLAKNIPSLVGNPNNLERFKGRGINRETVTVGYSMPDHDRELEVFIFELVEFIKSNQRKIPKAFELYKGTGLLENYWFRQSGYIYDLIASAYAQKDLDPSNKRLVEAVEFIIAAGADYQVGSKHTR